MLKAILFDCDGVLIDSFEANYDLYVVLTTSLKLHVPTREEYKKMFHMPLKDILKKLMAEKSEEEVERAFEQGLKMVRTSYRHDLITTPAGMIETIDALSKKYKLAVVTSRIRGRVFSIPQLQPLEKYFETAVYFEDTEKHKPDPEPLVLAAKRLKLKPEECLYVGDSDSDRIAAVAAGMKILIYNKIKPAADVPWTPDFKNIPHLVELFS